MNESPQPYPPDLGQGWLPKPPPPKVRDGYWQCGNARVDARICQGRIARGDCQGCTAWEAKV